MKPTTPPSMPVQCVFQDIVPWLISFSLDLMRTIRLALLVLVASALAAFSPATFDVFHNETDSTIVVAIVNTRGESFRAHSILPHDAGRFPVTNGTAVARTTSKKTLTRCNLMPLAKARGITIFRTAAFITALHMIESSLSDQRAYVNGCLPV